jgi:predicted nucleic acid-binding protein
MVKQNASIDASFWINVCAGNIVTYLDDYFHLFTTDEVAAEIRYPLDILGIRSQSSLLFNEWLKQNTITIQNPEKPVSWFQSGENSAIALAIEQRYFLLIDDANPYHRAKKAGLQVVGSSDFTIFLYDQGQVTFDSGLEVLRQIQVSKKQRRTASVVLETLKRDKDN